MQRHQAYIGNERRRKSLKNILDKSATFPKGVMLKDIDQSFAEWVEKELYIEFDGEKLPTFKLFSNQRINEYAQNWSHTDSLGNILMNFKTISRENNPKKGTNQGQMFNIPGERDYVLGYKPILQENGTEAYDIYTMKQPYTLDLSYTVSIITNKYELINKMNQLVQEKFSALQAYIFPNGHAMPMKLNEVADESEYNIDDRKYYSQSYKIDLLAYIVDPKGFNIVHMPSRLRLYTICPKQGKYDKKSNEVKIKIEDWSDNPCHVQEEDIIENQKVDITISFPSCRKDVEFTIDMDLVLDSVELTNVYDFSICLNEEGMDIDDGLKLYDGDNVNVSIERDDLFKDSEMVLHCINPNVNYDVNFNPESELDNHNHDINIII